MIKRLLIMLLWKLSDDAIMTTRCIDEIYEDVPQELQGVVLIVNEFHTYCGPRAKKAVEWLNDK